MSQHTRSAVKKLLLEFFYRYQQVPVSQSSASPVQSYGGVMGDSKIVQIRLRNADAYEYSL